MNLMRWIERALGLAPAAPAHDAEQITDLLPLLNCSGTHMVVEFPRHRRADAVAYRNEINMFHAGIHAAQRGERRN